MAYFLEDKSGQLTGSEFVDLNDRMRFNFRRTANDASHTAYMIYDTSPGTPTASSTTPLVALDYGPNNALGTISFASDNSMQMKKYLSKTSILGRYVSRNSFPKLIHSDNNCQAPKSVNLWHQTAKNTAGNGGQKVIKSGRSGRFLVHIGHR